MGDNRLLQNNFRMASLGGVLYICGAATTVYGPNAWFWFATTRTTNITPALDSASSSTFLPRTPFAAAIQRCISQPYRYARGDYDASLGYYLHIATFLLLFALYHHTSQHTPPV